MIEFDATILFDTDCITSIGLLTHSLEESLKTCNLRLGAKLRIHFQEEPPFYSVCFYPLHILLDVGQEHKIVQPVLNSVPSVLFIQLSKIFQT